MNILTNGKLASISLLALSSAMLLATLPTSAQAEDIADFTSSITANNPIQYGRISRGGIQQDWSGSESYTGIVNGTTQYRYTTYDFAASLFAGAPYVDISFFEPIGNVFASAYAGAYTPSTTSPGNSAAFGVNYLGDEGSSGAYFGVDAHFFDIILPAGMDLILVVNTTSSATLGIGNPYVVSINAYADTSFDDPPPVVTPPPAATPEPSTVLTLGTGLLGLAGTLRRRLMA